MPALPTKEAQIVLDDVVHRRDVRAVTLEAGPGGVEHPLAAFSPALVGNPQHGSLIKRTTALDKPATIIKTDNRSVYPERGTDPSLVGTP
jgi:hypothetical protein